MSCDIYEMMSHKFNFCDFIAEASIVSSRIYREQIETTIIFSSSLTLALAIWKVNWQIILNVRACCLKMLLLKIVPEIWHDDTWRNFMRSILETCVWHISQWHTINMLSVNLTLPSLS